ncbi:MAG: helix-turn-helix transcriptional regulator [Actinomycetota bacterium]
MVPAPVRSAVQTLLSAVRDEPCQLPIAEIVSLRDTGYDVSVDRSDHGAVVWVQPRRDPRFSELSDREHEVALLAAAGYSNQQIAAALFISLATVKDHMHAVLRTTGLSSRSQVIAAWHGGLQTTGEST